MFYCCTKQYFFTKMGHFTAYATEPFYNATNCLTMNKYLLFILFFSLAEGSAAQATFASWTDSTLLLNNGFVQRTIRLPVGKGQFITTAYKPIEGRFLYFTDSNADFQFELNGIVYSGRSNWSMQKIEKLFDDKSGNGAAVTIRSEDKKVELTSRFLLYPDLPLVRKNMVVKNLSRQTAALESVDVEKFNVPDYYATTFSWICHDYGRRRSIGPYDGNMQDALVTVHNSDWQQGIVIGNEAPGIVKHTSVFWNEPTIVSGLTHKDARYPFRKYISAGESFSTPQVFTIVYNNHKDPEKS